jgi:alpha-1,3-glucosyltransferase
LNTPPISEAASSRATSPTSSTFPSSQSLHRRVHHHLSFSTLLEKDEGIRNIVVREKERAEKEKAEREKQKEREEDASMGKRWVRWMHKSGMKPLVAPAAIGASIWVKWCIGLGSYSGQRALIDRPEYITNGIIRAGYATYVRRL